MNAAGLAQPASRLAAARSLADEAARSLAEADEFLRKLPFGEYRWVMAQYARASALAALASYGVALAALPAEGEAPAVRPAGARKRAAKPAAPTQA